MFVESLTSYKEIEVVGKLILMVQKVILLIMLQITQITYLNEPGEKKGSRSRRAVVDLDHAVFKLHVSFCHSVT